MDLKMPITIKDPESTLTRDESHPAELESRRQNDKIRHRLTPDHLRLKVVMSFTDASVRLDVIGASVSAEGKTISEAFRQLIAAASEHIASAEDEEASLSRYLPHTWFEFVSPDEAYAETPTERLDDVSELNRLYEFKGGLAIASFLETNPQLTSLLFDAHREIREHFGSDAEMVLELVADPEALGDQQLFVLIRTELPRKVAREHLAELDRVWWLDALPAAEGKIEFALE